MNKTYFLITRITIAVLLFLLSIVCFYMATKSIEAYDALCSISSTPDSAKFAAFMTISFYLLGGILSVSGTLATIDNTIEKIHNDNRIKNIEDLIDSLHKTLKNEEESLSKIREYKKLLDDGIITEEEFQNKKNELLKKDG